MVDEAVPGAPEPSGGPEVEVEDEGKPRSVIDASVDFVQTTVQYARQELGAAVRDKAIVPVQQTAIDVAVLIAMALTIFLGIVFIAVGLLLVLAGLIGWPAAMFLVGGVLIVLSIVIILVVRQRMEARRASL